MFVSVTERRAKAERALTVNMEAVSHILGLFESLKFYPALFAYLFFEEETEQFAPSEIHPVYCHKKALPSVQL